MFKNTINSAPLQQPHSLSIALVYNRARQTLHRTFDMVPIPRDGQGICTFALGGITSVED